MSVVSGCPFATGVMSNAAVIVAMYFIISFIILTIFTMTAGYISAVCHKVIKKGVLQKIIGYFIGAFGEARITSMKKGCAFLFNRFRTVSMIGMLFSRILAL